MDYRYHRKYQKERLVARHLDMALIKRLFEYLLPFKGWFCLAIGLLLCAKIIEAYVPIYIGRMTQNIINHMGAVASEKSSVFTQVLQGSFMMVGLLGFSYVMDVSSVLLKSWIGQKAIYNMRRRVYHHIIHMPLAFYDKNAVGRLITRTIHDIDQIDQMFTDSLVPLIGNLFLFLCIAIGILIVDWRVALLMVCILPLLAGILYIFRVNQRRCYETIRSIVSAMNTYVQENLIGMSTIRNFGLVKKEQRRFDDINEDYCNAYMESVEHFGFFIASLDFLTNLTLITMFVILVIYAPASGFQIGTYFTFSLYALMVFRPLIDLAERYNVLQSAFASSERVFDILDIPEELEGPQHALELSGIESIAFENVWFAYENEHWVLRGLTFDVRAGESLAIVGVTGEGKTSIMNLLLRFYEFQKGSIKINGHDIRSYSLASIRRQFSMVLQDPVLFSGTFKDNIALYDPQITPEKIEQAIDLVNLRSIVQRYPEGAEHDLLERGQSLSMGEKQLVSLARAVAQERSVLLFDEATANIDSATEKIIQDALEKIITNKTALIIAHRLSTIKNVDRILVLRHGVVAEMGTHAELLRSNGLYEKLYRLQN